METPSTVLNALVPDASFYPPASAYHVIVLESHGVPIIDYGDGNRQLNFLEVCMAHICFETKADVLFATVQREGKEWLQKKAVEWARSASLGDISAARVHLTEHIRNALSTVVEFKSEGSQKKTDAGGL